MNVRMRQRCPHDHLDSCITNDDLRFARIADRWIHDRQHEVLVVKRSRSLQAPKCRRLSITVITDRGRAEHRAEHPVGHVFAMYAPHQAGQAVRSMFLAPSIPESPTQPTQYLHGHYSLLATSTSVV